MNNAVKVSVIIVSYNVQEFLDLCLDSVYRALDNINAEVFVVDNNSSDSSVQLVSEYYPQTILIANDFNAGFSKANNQALALAQGTCVHFLNPDTIIEADFYEKSLAFMDAHPNAGAIGPRIIDGDGKYAVDSKKSFPSFWVSVAKVVGLSKLFPKSPFFNKYYAAAIGEHEVAPVEILSGCCMLVNKANLLQSGGGFDEQYFMYCEDVDMCHRLLLAGFTNYYYPEVSILHYKGESTRKLTYSYMKIFYEAHALFVKKYYPKGLGLLFNTALRSVLVLRNVFAVFKYIFSIVKIYILDALIIVCSLLLMRQFWMLDTFKESLSTPIFMQSLPLYLVIWMLSLYFNGAYDKPYSLYKTGRGMFWGTLIVFAAYGLLPYEYRQSRVVIFLSGLIASVSLLLFRTVFGYLKFIPIVPRGKNDFKAVVVCGELQELAVLEVITANDYKLNVIGRIGTENDDANGTVLADITHLPALQKVLSINEVVYNAKDLSYATILQAMQSCKGMASHKIISSQKSYLVGSYSSKNAIDKFGLTNYKIGSASSKRDKRIVDILCCLLFLPLSLVYVFTGTWWASMQLNFRILMGQYSWVGYFPGGSKQVGLPQLKQGIFQPVGYAHSVVLNDKVIDSINVKYAQEYSYLDDLNIFLKNFKKISFKIWK